MVFGWAGQFTYLLYAVLTLIRTFHENKMNLESFNQDGVTYE